MIRSAQQEPLDIFLVSAVLTVLGLRAYLPSQNYSPPPQAGGSARPVARA